MEIKESYIALQIEFFSTSETIEMRQHGFPLKIEHQQFVDRYDTIIITVDSLLFEFQG